MTYLLTYSECNIADNGAVWFSDSSMMRGLSGQPARSMTAPSRHKPTTVRLRDDFFPPLISRANGWQNQPPAKPHTFVRCLTTLSVTYRMNRLICSVYRAKILIHNVFLALWSENLSIPKYCDVPVFYIELRNTKTTRDYIAGKSITLYCTTY